VSTVHALTQTDRQTSQAVVSATATATTSTTECIGAYRHWKHWSWKRGSEKPSTSLQRWRTECSSGNTRSEKHRSGKVFTFGI